MKAERMMKWRVRRQSKCSIAEDNEDVRRSLEILDNVLAEFDDHDIFASPSDVSRNNVLVNGDESDISLSHVHREKKRWEDENGNKLEISKVSSETHHTPNGDVSTDIQSLDDSIDGTTSQDASTLDESRRCSAPPVPKRSPGTRLSNRDRHFFPKEEEGETDPDHESHRFPESVQLISEIDEHSRPPIANGKRKAALSVPTSSSSSPFGDNAAIRNHLRHGEITDEDTGLEFYLVRSNGDEEDAADDEVFLSSPGRSDLKSKRTCCRVCRGTLDHKKRMSAPILSCDTHKPQMDSTKSSSLSEAQLRRMRLDKKFAKVKTLLKTNQITGLDNPPPSFKPPPPPPVTLNKAITSLKNGEPNTSVSVGNISIVRTTIKTQQDSSCGKVRSKSSSEPSSQHGSRAKSPRKSHPELIAVDTRNVSPRQGEVKMAKPPNGLIPRGAPCVKCDQDTKGSSYCDEANRAPAMKATEGEAESDSNEISANQNILPTDVLCNNCINKGWTFRSAEVAPRSPSSLKRPPLGMSYSMEDDLSPGIKEISSPPPRTVDSHSDSVLSSPKSSPVTHLSTFSHSASSLGDGSSQSDLDFSTSVDSGKIPLASIKSLTLPTDMKLGPSPFYSPTEGECINGTDSKLGINGLEGARSSSAPPPPQETGHWKKDKTGLSRKEKQSKNDAVDSSRQAEEEEVTTEEKPKKRSVWKSILRRK